MLISSRHETAIYQILYKWHFFFHPFLIYCISYHNGNHYNSVRDPYRATIGIGLGLAELNPGMADQNLMNKAIDESLNETERKMLIDKARLTDYQATDQALLAQVAR